MTPEEFREGLFGLHTRRRGSVIEMGVKSLVGLSSSRSLFHDLYDDVHNKRVEVKSSLVQKKHQETVTEQNVLACIESATRTKRILTSKNWTLAKFDCNIEQVKKMEFDVLYYILLFEDCVQIFRILSEEIGSQINYSDKQHKGNVGEGQFHITHKNLSHHLRDYFYKNLTYDKFLKLLSTKEQ